MAKKDATGSKGKDKVSEGTVVSPYELNSKVLCRHIDNLYYEAKVIAVEQPADGESIYTVHYQGWNQRHDEKIEHSKTADRFLDFTPANVERAKMEMKEAQQRVLEAKKKHRRSLYAGDEKKSGGSDSRASTPSEKRGASSSRAASITSDKGASSNIIPPTTASASKKRKSAPSGRQSTDTVTDFVRKEEIRIDMPLVLKEILVDDQDLVVRQMKLLRVPARFTVTEIIRQYADYVGTSIESKDEITFEYSGDDAKVKPMVVTLIESSLGVQDYFDATLGSQLLYKFERPQYTDLLEEYEKKSANKEGTSKRRKTTETSSSEEPAADDKMRCSNYYGFIHLLRLFVRFGSMLGYTQWSERATQSIISHVQNFLKFLEVNRHKFFDKELDYETASPEYQKRAWTT